MAEKNKAAVALGKRRWAGVAPEERSRIGAENAAKRTAKLTPERRLAIAKKASKAAAKARKLRARQKKSEILSPTGART
jgi:hypothetical protein